MKNVLRITDKQLKKLYDLKVFLDNLAYNGFDLKQEQDLKTIERFSREALDIVNTILDDNEYLG